MINKNVINISLKMIIAGVIALIIGYLLNLTYYTTASAVAILSIQLTKKDFITVAIKRLVSSVLAVSFSAIMFYYLGQTFLMFSIFLVIFILLSWLFNVSEGIVLGVVLVGHFLIVDKITIAFYLEEILLIFVSLSTAFLANMFYPEPLTNKMETNIETIDSLIEKYLLYIIELNEKKNIKETNYDQEIEVVTINAKLIDKNLIIQNDHRYITYIYMREMQYKVLKDIEKNISRIEYQHNYIKMIISLLKDISESISINNNADTCLVALNSLKDFFLKEPLPETREEFETRAILFQILNEIEVFLNLKIEFHNKYPNVVLIK